MPRRAIPHPLALAVGERVRALRQEAGLTIEKLAFEASPSEGEGRFRISKGHLSSLERGLVMPTVATLDLLAARLEVLVADLVIDPERSPRERAIDLSRGLPPTAIKELVKTLARKG